MAGMEEDLMRDESLLGELALRLAKSPEDIATESLAYALYRSESARAHPFRLAILDLRAVTSWLESVRGLG